MANMTKPQGTTLTTVGGENAKVELVLKIKNDTHEAIASKVSSEALAIFNAYDNIQKGYYALLPEVARAIYSEAWKCLDGCKSFGQFLIQITGCSKATASELAKVAKTCYTSKGTLIDGMELFTYSEQIKLSVLEEEDRQAVLERIRALGEKHTRNDVIRAITEQKIGAGIEDKQKEDKKKVDNSISTVTVSSGQTATQTPVKLASSEEAEVYDDDTGEFTTIPSPNETTAYWENRLREVSSHSKTEMQDAILDLVKCLTQKELYIVDSYYMTEMTE